MPSPVAQLDLQQVLYEVGNTEESTRSGPTCMSLILQGRDARFPDRCLRICRCLGCGSLSLRGGAREAADVAQPRGRWRVQVPRQPSARDFQ